MNPRSKLKRLISRVGGAAIGLGLSHWGVRARELGSVDRGTQLLLMLRYRELLHSGAPLPEFSEVGFRAYSQTDEDGILLYLFSLLGAGGRRAVEIGSGDGIEGNSANLVVHHGWHALLLDGDAAAIERGREFYARSPDTWIHPPVLASEWIDAESIDALLERYGFTGDLDLLSIDIDGMDYWIWKGIRAAHPRVVVVEYNNMWGPERAVAVPYRRDRRPGEYEVGYYGASLPAFVKLGREKGYRLVGANRYHFNAFFVREDLGRDVLPEVTAESCLLHPFARRRHAEDLPRLIGKDWTEV